MSVPGPELKGFTRVAAGAGALVRVELSVRRSALALVGPDGAWGVLPGEYHVFVGGCGPFPPLGPLQPPLQGLLVVE